MDKIWNENRRYYLANALIKHTNVVSSGLNDSMTICEGLEVTGLEWMVFEYVVEHKDSFSSMIEMARDTGIPQSTFSRTVKRICSLGLVEKFQIEGNKKNIVLRPSDYGMEIYDKYAEGKREGIWEEFFDEIESISDEDIRTFVNALNKLTGKLPSADKSQEIKLI